MEWPRLVDLRPRIDRDYKHCYNSTTNSGRLLANPGRGTSLVSRHAVRARPFRNFPSPHTSLSLSAMPLVVFPLGSRCPRRVLRPLALSQLLFRRHRLLVLVMLFARPLSLTHRIAPFILKSPPLPRRLGCLVLWLSFVYVHHCKLVVCLAAIVRMARFGWLLARSWLCCAVGCLLVVAPCALVAVSSLSWPAQA